MWRKNIFQAQLQAGALEKRSIYQLYWSQNYNIIKRRKGPIGIARTGK